MTLFHKKPNIIKIVMSDETGEGSQFIVGYALSEAVAVVEAAFGFVGDAIPVVEKKARKPRRTKAEMATAEAAPVDKDQAWP